MRRLTFSQVRAVSGPKPQVANPQVVYGPYFDGKVGELYTAVAAA
jgi:hypothetical protein